MHELQDARGRDSGHSPALQMGLSNCSDYDKNTRNCFELEAETQILRPIAVPDSGYPGHSDLVRVVSNRRSSS